jgi:HD-like signal output (HDOD) protein
MSTSKKRIVFVDDEPAILGGLRSLLYKERQRWDMAFVACGSEALDALRLAPADVVVSDMRMPQMDGAMLLNQVKLEFPATARIMLTGHAEREAITRALPALHQLLSKPCNAASLREAIERGFAFAEDTSDRLTQIRSMVGGIDMLPAAPHIVSELSDALGAPAMCPAEVASIISRDPGLAAKVLQLANSAYCGARGTTSIKRAVVMLGAEQLRYISLNTSMFDDSFRSTFAGFSLDESQERSLRVARMAAAMLGGATADEAFAAALLHDIGHVVLWIGMGDRYRLVLQHATATGRPVELVERELLGVTHGEIGAMLLALWGLPASVVTLVRHHHEPDKVPAELREIACAVHLADLLGTTDGDVPEDAIARAGWAHRIPAWRAAADAVR